MTDLQVSLSWRHSLEWREPAFGFASRLAALNGVPLQSMIRELGLPRRAIERGEIDGIRSLSTIGSASCEALCRFSPVVDGHSMHVGVGTEVLHTRSLRRRSFFFCPHCVREDLSNFGGPEDARPWLRLEWIITHFRSCERHGVYLSTIPMTYWDDRCFDFAREMRQIIPRLNDFCSESPSAAPSAFQSWLNGRIEGNLGSNSWLDDLELYVAIDFCEALGLSIFMQDLPPHTKGKGFRSTATLALTEERLAEAAEQGFRVAKQGQQAITDTLASFAAKRLNGKNKWGLFEAFGPVYRLLDRTKEDPKYAKPRDLVRSFVIEVTPLPAGSSVLGQPLKHRINHTTWSLASESGLSEPAVRRMLMRQSILRPSASASDENSDIIKVADVEKLLSDLQGSLDTMGVSKATGIPRLLVRFMIGRGILPAIAGVGAINDKLLISSADLQQTLDSVFLGAVDVAALEGDLVHVAKLAGTDAQFIIAAIHSNSIWKGLLHGQRDFRNLLIRKRDIHSARGHARRRIGLTAKEICDFLKVTTKALPPLKKQGHLLTAREYCHDTGRMRAFYTRDSAVEFRNRYVTSLEIAVDSNGYLATTVSATLTRAGIQPVFGAASHGSSIYLRAQINEVLRLNPSPWVRWNGARRPPNTISIEAAGEDRAEP